MLYQRIVDILNILNSSSNPLPAQKIGELLSVSPGTVREEIKNAKSELRQYGIEIISAPHVGYWIEVEEQRKYDKAIQCILDVVRRTENQRERAEYVIRSLLLTDFYQKSDDWAEELHVSRSSMTRILREVRKILERYGLRIKSKPFYGLRLEGSEVNRRLCLAQYCKVPMEQTGKIIEKLLLEVLKKFRFSLTDIGFSNLVLHLQIAVKRVETGNCMIEGPDLLEEEYKQEMEIAAEIMEKMETVFGLRFPQSERDYVAIHLLGKRNMHRKGREIGSDMLLLVKNVFEEIKKRYGIDFTDDYELRGMLCAHMLPMLERLKYNMRQKNPILEEIQRSYKSGYPYAKIVEEKIIEQYNLYMGEDELGYLVLHFALAIERKKQGAGKKKILIVCSTGTGTSRLLLRRLIQIYGLDKDSLDICGIFEMEEKNLSCYACIFSTVQLPQSYKIPVLTVSLNDPLPDKELVNTCLGEVGEGIEKYFSEEYFCQKEAVDSREEALERKLDWRISSIGTSQIEAKLSQADMVLLAPQNRMVKDKVENMCRMEGIPLLFLDRETYAKMDGEIILEQILEAVSRTAQKENKPSTIMSQWIEIQRNCFFDGGVFLFLEFSFILGRSLRRLACLNFCFFRPVVF